MILKTKLNSSSIKSLQWKVSSNQKIEYSIVITKNLFDKKNNLLAMSKKKNKKKKRRLIFIDSNVNNLYQKKIDLSSSA